MSTLEEKKHHEVKLREGLGDLSVKRMELQNALSSSWPKQVSEKKNSLVKLATENTISSLAETLCKSIVYLIDGDANILAICY